MDALRLGSPDLSSRCDDLRAPGVMNLIVSMYVAGKRTACAGCDGCGDRSLAPFFWPKG